MLQFILTPLQNPYLDDPRLKHELWGQIQIMVQSQTILDWQWDLGVVIEWFRDCKDKLLTEFPPSQLPDNLSLSEFHQSMMEEILEDIEKDFEEILEYYHCHCFKISGTPTLPLFIGKRRNGVGEVSYYDDGKFNLSHFSMERFVSELENEIYTFLERWKANFFTSAGLDRILAWENGKGT